MQVPLRGLDAGLQQSGERLVWPIDTLFAGELVRFRNTGKVLHMAVGARFKTMADATKAAKELTAGNDKAAEKLAIGEVSFMDTNSPGAMQQETIDVKPGVYVLACFMATNGKEPTRLGMERGHHHFREREVGHCSQRGRGAATTL